jgi:hypothetical protein
VVDTEGGEKGQIVSRETQRVLNRLLLFGVKNIENECNKVANHYRELWKDKNPNDSMTEFELPYNKYSDGISELDPPFLLTEPSSIRVEILDARDTSNPILSAKVTAKRNDLTNPKIMLYLQAFDVSDSKITWIGFKESFQTVIIHEFLHCCGEIPELRPGLVDGLIRHNKIGTEAFNNLEKKNADQFETEDV